MSDASAKLKKPQRRVGFEAVEEDDKKEEKPPPDMEKRKSSPHERPRLSRIPPYTPPELADLPGFCDLPDHPHLEGVLLPPTQILFNNSADAFPFENEFCKGRCLALHRPAEVDGEDDLYADFFASRRRLWELRVQLEFKVPPPGTLWIGLELDDYAFVQYSAKKLMDSAVATARKLCGMDVYHSTGDDPKKYWGELERPVCVLPLWCADQLIFTPPGETPPLLSGDDLPDCGIHRRTDKAAFSNKARRKLQVGPTYTLCFWSCSALVDGLRWVLRIGRTTVDLDKLCGAPPVHLVMYSLQDPADCGPEHEHQKDVTLAVFNGKHAQTWKTYYLRLAFWSSKNRPRGERLRRLLGKPEPVRKRDLRKQSFLEKSLSQNVLMHKNSTLESASSPAGGAGAGEVQREPFESRF